MEGFEKKQFEYQGVKTTYWVGGKGKPLVFFHGGGGMAKNYRPVLELLAKKYLVIAPDIPGFGESSTPRAIWGLGDYGAYFKELIRVLKLEAVTVVGHSLGGGVALHTASNNKQVDKLVLIDSAGLPPGIKFRKVLYLVGYGSVKDYFDKKKFRRVHSSALKANLRNATNLPRVLKIAKKCLYASPWPDGDITADTLLIWAKKDDIFPVEYTRLFSARIKKVKTIVIDDGHGWVMFEPEKAVEAIG